MSPTVSMVPSPQPTVVPTRVPSPRPSTPYPTSQEHVMTVEGMLTLKHISFEDELNYADLSVLKSVLSEIMHIGSRNVHGFTRISMMDSKRIDNEDVAVIFNVDIMAGRHNASAYDFREVYNESWGFLLIAVEDTDIFLTKLAIQLDQTNGTTLGVYSISTVSINYFRLGDGSHKLQRHEFLYTLLLALLAGLVGFTSIFVAYTIVTRAMIAPPKRNAEDESALMELTRKNSEGSVSPNSGTPDGNVVWDSSHSYDIPAPARDRSHAGGSTQITNQLMASFDRTFNAPSIRGLPLSSRSQGGGESLESSAHSYEYEDENDGKFYSAYASKKKSPKTKGPAIFEKIDTSSSHSSIPELLP